MLTTGIAEQADWSVAAIWHHRAAFEMAWDRAERRVWRSAHRAQRARAGRLRDDGAASSPTRRSRWRLR